MADLVDRRSLIGGFLAVSALLSAGPAGAAPALQRRLAALSASAPEAARRIGRAYLAAEPGNASLAHIHRILAARLGTDADALDDNALAERVDRVIRDDFARHDSVTLAGWVLSKTEVQL